MRTLCIDRFEGSLAICEEMGDLPKKPKDIRYFGIEKNELPSGAKEGDVIVIDSNGTISLDENKTAERRAKIGKLQKNLWK